MNSIKEYLLSVSAAALLASLTVSLLPNSSTKKVVNFIATLLLILAVVTPIARINVNNIAKSIAMFEMDMEQMESGVKVNNREILAELIKERCETYILDKAEELGITIRAEITLSEEGEYPYPVHVLISGKISAEDRAYLQKVIEQDIGITAEQQEWR